MRPLTKDVCPRKARVGKCRVCGGQVTETFSKNPPPWEHVKYGATQYQWYSSGLFCQGCGIMYKMLPKEKSDGTT